MTEQQQAFWDVVEVFEEEGLLPYVMLIGSWAEYIYQNFHLTGFRANLKTGDVDFLYTSTRRPPNRKFNISESLKKKGFTYTESRMTGVGRFIKEDLLDIEFLTRAFSKGEPVNQIPSLGLKASGLQEINMLTQYPLNVECNSFVVTVPEPEAYVLQKLRINPLRKSAKKEKDIESVEGLLNHLNHNRVAEIFESLDKKEKKAINETKARYFIELKPG